MRRIYLDNAATSWPKPNEVYDAVDAYLRDNGAPAGRGGYDEAQQVERSIDSARRRAARLLGALDPRNVIFTSNGTDSLNLAIHGLLQPGDHVVTTQLEHNSVLRPLYWRQQHADLTVTRLPTGADTLIDPDEVERAIQPKTRLIAVTQMSNVTGAIQPAEAICHLAARYGIPCLIDAAQAAGHQPMQFAEIGETLIACPSHKGLLGPLGGGLLYVPSSLAPRLEPVRQGGTGTVSEVAEQPSTLPDRYESGNHNVPALVGLNAGLNHLESLGDSHIKAHLDARRDELLKGLRELSNVKVYGPDADELRGSVIPFRVAGFAPHEVAAMLDSTHRIQVRAGFLCAPLIHKLIGAEDGGVVRLSPGLFTNADDTAAAVQAIAELADLG